MNEDKGNGIMGALLTSFGAAALIAGVVAIPAYVAKRWVALGVALLNNVVLAGVHYLAASQAEWAAQNQCGAQATSLPHTCAMADALAALASWPWIWLHIGCAFTLVVALLVPVSGPRE